MQKTKVLAILLAVVMVLGLCSMASAAAPNDKVQVNNMMVDASKVDLASFGLSAEEESTPVETFAATATYSDLDVNANLPPIKKILIQDFEESDISSNVGIMQGNAIYTLTMPSGTEDVELENKVVTFELGGTSTTPAGSTINLTYNGTTYSATAGGSISITMTLTPNVSTPFTATWTALNSDGSTTAKNRSCQLTAYVPADTTDVSLKSLKIAGETAAISSSTVGGVTRYVCVAELENVTSLTGLEVVAKLGSTSARATLGGTSGTQSGKTVTFTNVDLTSSKNLVITNSTYSRTYQVSAHIKGGTVTVHIAIRSFLADEYLENRTNWYSGYGTSSVSGTEKTSLLGFASYLRSANSPTSSNVVKNYNGNAPESVASNGRYIFSDVSYKTITIPATYTVRDALECFVGLKNNAQGTKETYFSSFSIQGSDSYIEAMGYYTLKDPTQPDTEENRDYHCIGEFDCGSASGWMYTARTSRTDVTSALPNAGANTWPVSNGMYIDWYYTAAYGMDFGYSMFG